MADELLSQAELETLLSALESSDEPPAQASGRPAPQRPRTSPQRVVAATPRTHEKIVPYDFRRPQSPAKEPIRLLRNLHEGFAHHFATALSTLLRIPVAVKLSSLDQLTYGEFIRGLENPSCFNLLGARPLEGPWFLDLSPAILYPMIDRLLGGGGLREASPLARRPLTEIELRLVARVTAIVREQLNGAWKSVLPLELSVERVECNPAAAQVLPPTEAVFVLAFELSIHETSGLMTLCIPRGALETIQRKANSWDSAGRRIADDSPGPVGENLRQSRVELVARLAETKITSADLFNLRVGDIITTESGVQGPIGVSVEGVPKFRAHAGAFKGRKAVRIEETLDPPTS